MQTKVTHLTSVHSRYDTRIFLKECVSLAKESNYSVNLVVADGLPNEVKSQVHIYDVGLSGSRMGRALGVTKRVLKKAIELDSDIYHFHDPELISTGLKLKKIGKKRGRSV